MDQVLVSLTGYGAVGALVAVVFLLWGIDRIDPAAHGAWLVRPLLVPSVVVLWPVVLVRWIALERQRASGRSPE
ncbi:MAG: hypothetical protein B7Z10_01685 [Rhodobacterales bacterium 32-66-7]|nr:MAG: hypothetical protein B7Z31_00855 [Rhodobacterales bacterium 12-65-15]OYX26965.1 MAG: hypothetical protein B7Z10_01685 [Rhodobacterales bacterium 32-66-7]